ncbi:MAG: deoxyribodipyrimidine photolyase, partial [Gemmatimonadetes bacterium]|nr:deoxyribodipyrimidine photolyase [Gemmatimonadota bacterium]
VPPVTYRGGSRAAGLRLAEFFSGSIDAYATERNRLERDLGSGLSPYLHFGHISAHQIFSALAARESWTPARLGADTRGKRSGWWGMSESAEAFLDQLVTWRELGFNRCHHREDHASYEALPEWARRTLAEHEGDPREHVYGLDVLEAARTHDPLWNAAQIQLRREGRIHNYLRMLWGKKILEWTPDPRTALDIMIHLNDRWAVDGRDPNSYTGMLWVLGLHDRAWGPERPIFGKIRYMSSANTARKMRVKGYIEEYANDPAG